MISLLLCSFFVIVAISNQERMDRDAHGAERFRKEHRDKWRHYKAPLQTRVTSTEKYYTDEYNG